MLDDCDDPEKIFELMQIIIYYSFTPKKCRPKCWGGGHGGRGGGWGCTGPC